MKKVAIITLNGYYNYGNRLQNYAVQEVLRSLGFSVETIIIKPAAQISSTPAKLIRRSRSLITMSPIRNFWIITTKLQYYLNKNRIDTLNEEKTKAFKQFSLENIVEVDRGLKKDSCPPDLANMYDYFISGSDQVWNPNHICGLSTYFLTFAPKEKRVAYAASFGVSEIPDELKGLYGKWLSEMYRISVREEAGARIVKELTGRDAVVLVDPTMMLTKEEWLAVAKTSRCKPEKKYLLTYFLGQKTRATELKIKEIADTYGLMVVNLADTSDPERYIANPAEFVDYINSASFVCTDSFHGVVFSILMETPFVAFKRHGLGNTASSMYSRIDTLLRTFKFQDRRAEDIVNLNNVLDMDYSHVAPILAAERRKAIDYLKEALDIREVRTK